MSSGKRSIQVAIKVRPLLRKEKDQQTLWRVVDNSIQLMDSQADPIYFDHIFDQDASNQIIFDKVGKPIVQSAIEGINGTIFAYGQTSSGKTYTMMGDEENPGVMVLAAKEIFRQIQTTERQFLLRIGYIEIYNERIYDLLNKKNQDLKIHETANGNVSVNCEERFITCEDDLLQHLTQGSKERTVGETNMNERSSRSHAIFRIIIESRKIDRSEDDSVTESVLNLVDLAGSERADQTGARGTRLKEGGHINKSLMFLSNVIKRLSEDEDNKYVSYRDSKLTRILQASLGGNALTAIICTIKPTAVEETQSTLNFALRAKIIKTKPQVNESVSDATMMKRLEREIKQLKLRLEEEQQKNASQIKVRQLEQRIRNEDLKIISCNSLHSARNREKRRRTWCPSSTNLDASTSQLPSALPVPPSRLQPPKTSHYLTPLITMRPKEPPSAPKASGSLPGTQDPMPEIDEEFTPADMVNFEMLSPLQTPKLKPLTQIRVSITPKVSKNVQKLLEVVENDFMELQEFTNLENRTDIQHDTDGALKQLLNSLTNRNAFLEKERLEYLENKNEIDLTRERSNEYEARCDELQIQVTKLTASNKTANDKISKYEKELSELKTANEKLAMENREAVNLDVEFSRHKAKSKLRENELLELLKDKEQELTKLEKSLKSISEERLHNTKEELMQLSQAESNINENGKVCVKCEDLERLLEENRKVTVVFQNLTLEYQQVKLNLTETEIENNSSKARVAELEEQQKAENFESENLRKELKELKEKLYDIQKEYEQVNTENSAKTKECVSLNQQIEVARQEMLVLQDKYNALELSWQIQQQKLKEIELQYAEIENKYQNLQTEYKQLECTKGGDSSLTNYENLQKENVELLTQIGDLKIKLQDVQQQISENAEKSECTLNGDITNEESGVLSSITQKRNEELKQQLSQLQTQFEDLQKEYDDLSNQLMDNLQESENLKEQNSKLEVKLKSFEEKCAEVSKAETEIGDLKSQLEKLLTSERKSLLNMPPTCRNSSMRSSGVCIEDEEAFEEYNNSDDLHKKFCQMSEYLTEIELEHQDGKRKVFKTPSLTTTPNYKLCLRNISGVSKTQQDLNDEMENIQLHGSFKQHSFQIVELNHSKENGENHESSPNEVEKENKCKNCSEFINKLNEQITNLKALNEEERQSNKALLENTERTLSEMRDQITQLSAELLEKSMFVENCACKTYQKQIESLEKEKADMTLVCEELQEKVANFTFDGSLMDLGAKASCDQSEELEPLRSKYLELQETFELQSKMLEDLTQQNLDLESDLKEAKVEMQCQGKTSKELYNQLQLEMLEKLEISANEHRDNMKKYNSEWEERRKTYENTIKELQSELDAAIAAPIKGQKDQCEDNKAKEEQDSEAVGETTVDLGPNIESLQIKNESLLSKELDALRQDFDLLQSKYSQLLKEQTQRSLEQEDLKAREEKLIKEKAELDTELVELRHSYKELNETYKILVVEKETLYEESKNIEKKLSDLEEKLKKSDELQDRIDTLVAEKEQLEMEKKQVQQKLQSAESRIEEYCSEDASREETIRTLQSKVDTFEMAEEERLNLSDNLERLQKELSHTQSQLEKHEEEKKNFEQRLFELSEANKVQQEKTEIQMANIKNEKEILEVKLKDYDTLHERKASLEEQLKSFESVVQEKQMLEQKLNDFVALKEAYLALEEQILQVQKALEEKVKQYEVIEGQKLLLEEQLKSLETIAEDKLEIEKKFKDFETLQDAHKALETRILNLESVAEEKERIEEKVNEIEKACQEHVEALTSVKDEKEKLESLLSETNQVSKDREKQLELIKQEKEEMEQQLQKLKQVKISIESQLQEHSKSLASLEQENTTMEEKLQQKSIENQKQATEIADLHDKISSLQTSVHKSEQTLDDLKQKEIMSFNENKSLSEKIAALTSSSASLELEKCKLDKEMQELRSENISLQKQIKLLTEVKVSLTEQCSQLAEEKLTLTEQLKCLGEKAKVEESLKQMINEKAEIAHNLRLATEKLQLKQDELDRITKDCEKSKRDLELLKCSLLSFNSEKKKLEEQLERYKHLAEEKSKIDKMLTNLQCLYEETQKALEQEKEGAQQTRAKFDQEILHYKQKEETLSQKIEMLYQQLHEMSNKKDTYEKLLVDYKVIENALDIANKQNTEFRNEITQLKTSAVSSTQSQNDVIVKQTAKLIELETQLDQSRQKEQELHKNHEKLQFHLQNEKTSLQHQADELKGFLAELQLKYDSLQVTSQHMQKQNEILEQQVKKSNEQMLETITLKKERNELQIKYTEILQKMEATVKEAELSSQALSEKLQYQKQLLAQQLESYDALRSEVTNQKNNYELEKEQLTSTITSLQNANSSLEEKIREITINNFKHDLQTQTADVSANTSLDGANTSSPTSRNRRSLDSMNISVEDIISASSTRGTQLNVERKNRRLSSFNERRTSYWGVTHDKETMTMPVDTNCNCVELDRKLKDCEKKLFIRESQVTALNMELKNHPLKDQNAALTKRLQEEQDKNRSEIKRYKQKLYEQTMKTEKALAAAANVELKPSVVSSSISTVGEPEKPPIVMENAETQTDCDLSASFNKLQSKYNDLINICRYRRNTIKDLEAKLEQKENIDGKSLPDDGQMTILKSQYETLKKEHKIVSEKYAHAKIVLSSRRDEINRLRSELEQSKS